MLTARGWWLLLLTTVIAAVTVTGAWVPTVAILCLSILAMVFVEWIVFTVRVRTNLPKLIVERSVQQGERVVSAGWAGLPFTVRITLRNTGQGRLPLVFAVDSVGTGQVQDEHDSTWNGVLQPGSEQSFEYELQSDDPGAFVFAGVSVTIADLAGLFVVRHFLPLPQRVVILPVLVDDRGRQRAHKRFNTLPPPGLHRLRRPGSGSELLDLRDYLPGDPPKMIAWKPSARRDRLITREFESDVPIRCLIFLDASESVRTGDAPLSAACTTAAGIIQAATANRDLVGLTIIDDSRATITVPGRTSTHTIGLLHELANAAARLPTVAVTDPTRLVKLMEPHARLRCPAAFHTANAALPWGLFWRPLLDRRWGWLVFLPLILAPFLAVQPWWLDVAARAARRTNPGTGRIFVDLPLFLVGLFAVLMAPSTLALLFWLFHGLTGFLPGERRRTRHRKTLAAILAHDAGDNPALVERALKDDDAFAELTGRWLALQGIRVPTETPTLTNPAKIGVLVQALLRAVARARDNELFVLFADLALSPADLAPLHRAIKLARGRHHQVLIVLPPPSSPRETKTIRNAESSLVGSVMAALAETRSQNRETVRKLLLRAGAIVVRPEGRDAVRVVLDHLDRLRGARSLR